MTNHEFGLLLASALISLVFGYLRFAIFAGPASDLVKNVYKALAHVWVGLLFGVAIVLDGWWWLSPVALTILEVVAFIVRRK